MAGANSLGAETPSRWSVALRFLIAALLIVYLLRSVSIDWSGLAGFWTNPELLGVATLTLVVTVCLTAVRLPVLLRAVGFELKLWPALQLSLIGMFFGLFLPGSASGDAAKIYYTIARRKKGTRAELATIILFDRAMGMWAMFAVPLLAAPFFDAEIASNASFQNLLRFCALTFVVGGLVLGAVIFSPDRWMACGRKWLRWELPWRSMAAVREFRSCLQRILHAFLISLGAHFAAITTTAVIAAAVVPSSARPELALVVPLGFIANAIPLTPGGLGVGELAFHRLFQLVGLEGGAEVAIAWRAGVMAIALVGGLLYARGFKAQAATDPAALEMKEQAE